MAMAVTVTPLAGLLSSLMTLPLTLPVAVAAGVAGAAAAAQVDVDIPTAAASAIATTEKPITLRIPSVLSKKTRKI
jgi:ABC-type transport system involved in cytochrome c biogenesis permease component